MPLSSAQGHHRVRAKVGALLSCLSDLYFLLMELMRATSCSVTETGCTLLIGLAILSTVPPGSFYALVGK